MSIMGSGNLNKHLILYADDDIDDLEIIKDGFAAFSPNVDLITVRNGAEAIDWLKSLKETDRKPCLIILDINMPKMDGREALLRIRTMNGLDNIPVMMFTTSNKDKDADFAMRYKADFLTKPVDVVQMDLIINRFLVNCKH